MGKDNVFETASFEIMDQGQGGFNYVSSSIVSQGTHTMVNTGADVPSNANKLNISIPSTINNRDLRCDKKGDQYAQAIFTNGSGYYDKLKTSFGNLATICNRALKNKHIDVTNVKAELKDGKKKALNQKSACEQRKTDMQKIYSQTKDIFAIK